MTVPIGELRTPKRAEEANPDFEIPHEMQVTLHTLSGGKRGYDLYSQIEAAIARRLKGPEFGRTPEIWSRKEPGRSQ